MSGAKDAEAMISLHWAPRLSNIARKWWTKSIILVNHLCRAGAPLTSPIFWQNDQSRGIHERQEVFRGGRAPIVL
jgi:hypothetical protein